MENPIVIFDSGVGGFSILKEFLTKEISFPIIYLADQSSFPYGEKSTEWLVKRLSAVAAWAQSFNPSEVIIACNTASVGGLNHVRSILACPVIGIDPVVKPAAKYSKSLILGTTSTIKSSKLANLILTHEGAVSSMALPSLPTLIEEMEFEQVENNILEVKKVVDRENIKAIGLSCTHFPLVKALFANLIPGVTIIDPSEAVAAQAVKLLPPPKIKNQKSKIMFCTTGDVLRFTYQIKHYLNLVVMPEKVSI